MIESIARKERIETQPANAPCYLWTVPQKPVSVRLPFDVIDRLEREAVEHFRSLTSRGSEIGGVLLGRVAPGSPSLVSIDDFELIECDYSRGPLYRLSEADLGRFERVLERQLAGGRRVTGFFRSHTRKGVTLDAEDIAFFEARFRDPNQVALLLRPFATKASVGAFFIWENGSVRGEASALEFPFRTADLAPARGAGISEFALPTPPPAPPAARPPARAQIVPIATRREIALPPPVAAPPEDAPEQARSEERPVPEIRRAEPPASEPRRVSSPAPRQEQDKRGTPAQAEPRKQSAQPASRQEAEKSKSAAAQVSPARAEAEKSKPAPAAPAARPEWDKGRASDKAKIAAKVEAEPAKSAASMFAAKSVFDVAPVSEPASGIAGLLAGKTGLIAGAAATVLVLVGLFVYPGILREHSTRPTPAAASRQDSSPLSLRVERTANELLLTWNRDAEPIQAAKSARLSISDGERHENYDMDMEQLRKGSIVYMPVTPDVSFRMEVMGQNSQKTASELVRVLRTSPMPGEAAAAAPQESSSESAAAAEAALAEPEPTPRRVPTPTKPFQAESLVRRLRSASSGDLPEAPVLGGDAPAQAVNLGGVAAPFASAPAAMLAPAEKKSEAPVQGGRVQPGQLISRKEPVYPSLARQTGVKGAVELDATVGADGRVKSARVVSGHPILQKAAVDAVLQWVYRPTLLNGKPVESQTRVVLNFVGQR